MLSLWEINSRVEADGHGCERDQKWSQAGGWTPQRLCSKLETRGSLQQSERQMQSWEMLEDVEMGHSSLRKREPSSHGTQCPQHVEPSIMPWLECVLHLIRPLSVARNFLTQILLDLKS